MRNPRKNLFPCCVSETFFLISPKILAYLDKFTKIFEIKCWGNVIQIEQIQVFEFRELKKVVNRLICDTCIFGSGTKNVRIRIEPEVIQEPATCKPLIRGEIRKLTILVFRHSEVVPSRLQVEHFRFRCS